MFGNLSNFQFLNARESLKGRDQWSNTFNKIFHLKFSKKELEYRGREEHTVNIATIEPTAF